MHTQHVPLRQNVEEKGQEKGLDSERWLVENEFCLLLRNKGRVNELFIIER
jgi:hypothetical protein